MDLKAGAFAAANQKVHRSMGGPTMFYKGLFILFSTVAELEIRNIVSFSGFYDFGHVSALVVESLISRAPPPPPHVDA
jgi:hypothetical protein